MCMFLLLLLFLLCDGVRKDVKKVSASKGVEVKSTRVENRNKERDAMACIFFEGEYVQKQ